MISFPNAKINIGLNIIKRRADGFHNIETCFYPIGLKDVLEFLPFDKQVFQTTGLSIGTNSSNLCLKAYNLIAKDYPLPKLQIALHKRIPIGAGLGGGSANASFMLRTLNDFFNLNISEEQLTNYATQLGSDCAFFLHNQPAMAYKKGDKLQTINLSLKDYYLFLVKPDISINTQQAYAQIAPQHPKYRIREILQSKNIEEWKDKIVNDFETPIFFLHPQLKKIKQKLYKLGAIYASMSGSGSTLYGIFKTKPDATVFSEHFTWVEKLK